MDYFIEVLKSIVFGIVEGITEWLPISSTGHMIILGQFFGFKETQGADFYNFFLVIIQLGAILAVVLSFFRELWPFGKKKSQKEKIEIWGMWGKIVVASIPAGILGVLLDDFMDTYLFNYLVVSITLIVYGLVFLLIEYLLSRKSKRIKERYHLDCEAPTSYTDDVFGEAYGVYPLFNIKSTREITLQLAMAIGLAQCLALIPGTSRSGVTICAALLLSIDRKTSAKFSFYLSIPAMVGGSLIKGIMYGIKVHKGTAALITGSQIGLILIGMAVAFVVSFFVIRFFMKLLNTKTFIGFGIYRIAFGLLLLVLFFTVGKGQLNSLEAVAGLCNNLPSTFGSFISTRLAL